jgi:hypothetical protein
MLLLFLLSCRRHVLRRRFSGKPVESGEDDDEEMEMVPLEKIAKGKHGVFKSKGEIITNSQQEKEVETLNRLGTTTAGSTVARKPRVTGGAAPAATKLFNGTKKAVNDPKKDVSQDEDKKTPAVGNSNSTIAFSHATPLIVHVLF